MQLRRNMIDTTLLIYSLLGIVVLSSTVLVVKVIRSGPKVVPNQWGTPTPMNERRQRIRSSRPLVVPPPPQMFRQR